MATRGARPKPAALRVVSGTHRSDRHGDAGDASDGAAASADAFGKIQKPAWLKGEAAKAWKRWIEPAFWLDAAREASAIAFCELWSEFRASPANFQSARHGQLRSYMSELGLTDERNRIVSGEDGKKDKGARFFD